MTISADTGHQVTQLAARSEELSQMRDELNRYTLQLNTSRQQCDRLKVVITKQQVRFDRLSPLGDIDWCYRDAFLTE